MGKYINKGNADFTEARNQEYVDKSGLIAFVNVSRARRFGKSLALQMLYVGNKAVRIFNPTSVMTVLTTGVCKDYWGFGENIDLIVKYIA